MDHQVRRSLERESRPRSPHSDVSTLLARVALPHRSGRERVAAGCAALVIIGMIGWLDSVTSAVLSLAVLYVLVVVAVTLFSGFVDGLVAAAASTVAWVLGDSALDDAALGTYVINGCLRLAALTIVVILVDRLVTALATAHRSDQRSREFLATAAHQLRTPIAGIRASADALFHLDASPEQEQLLANLAAETARAGHLIGSLLRVARLDQGEILVRESVDLRVLADAEVARARALTTLDIQSDTTSADSPSSDTTVTVDVRGTAEAIANILDNARRHARSSIVVTVERRERLVCMVVRDDGPGVPVGSEEQMFERFVSLDGSGGSGLGLAIARQVVQLQGGDVSYTDGSFVVSLPVGVPSTASANVAPT